MTTRPTVTIPGRRDTARGQAGEEAVRIALGPLAQVKRPEQVVAEDRQERRRQGEAGDEGHEDRDGQRGPRGLDHLELAEGHRSEAHDHRGGARADDRADPAGPWSAQRRASPLSRETSSR